MRISDWSSDVCSSDLALALWSLIGDRRVDQARFTLTLVGITVASALAMTLYPVLAAQLGLSDTQAGFLIGASIHDVAPAIGGGLSFSPQPGEGQTIVSLTRFSPPAPYIMPSGVLSAPHAPEDGARKRRAA